MTDASALTTVATAEILSAAQLSRQHVEILKRTVAQGTTDEELQLFLHVCRRTGLDPFARQIYAVKRAGKMTIQTSIDGFRLIAERTGKYTGQIGPLWAGTDLAWTEVWTKDRPPYVAKIGILRSDFTEPLWAIAKWAEYVPQSGQDHMWKKMPAHMLGKVAEALALRRAFPQELSGLYGEEEVQAPIIESNEEQRLMARVTGFKGILQAATSADELDAKWNAAEAFRESVHDANPEAAEDLNVTYRTCREALTYAKTANAKVKCDGNHAGPHCGDPQCWNDAPASPASAPTTGKAEKSIEERIASLKAALRAAGTTEAAEKVWRLGGKLLAELNGQQLEDMSLVYESRLNELREVK
jgi:phage recombination protein Bet